MPEGKPLVIGVNVNENTGREPNPHVPWSPVEIAQVAAESERAGAALMHFHGRTETGGADHSAGTHAEIVRRVRQVSSLLLAPSMANVPGYSVTERLANIGPNQADPATRADLLPIDMGCANMDLFDPDQAEYASDDRVFINDVATQRELLDRCPGLGLAPYLASFNLSWTRAVLAHRAAGRLPNSFAVVFVLGGREFVAAHPTSSLGFRSHVELVTDQPGLEWLVSSYRGNVLDVAEDVVAAGGHVVIGVGDYPYVEFGCPSTPELVDRVAAIGRRHGRRPATVAESAELLGVSVHAHR